MITIPPLVHWNLGGTLILLAAGPSLESLSFDCNHCICTASALCGALIRAQSLSSFDAASAAAAASTSPVWCWLHTAACTRSATLVVPPPLTRLPRGSWRTRHTSNTSILCSNNESYLQLRNVRMRFGVHAYLRTVLASDRAIGSRAFAFSSSEACAQRVNTWMMPFWNTKIARNHLELFLISAYSYPWSILIAIHLECMKHSCNTTSPGYSLSSSITNTKQVGSKKNLSTPSFNIIFMYHGHRMLVIPPCVSRCEQHNWWGVQWPHGRASTTARHWIDQPSKHILPSTISHTITYSILRHWQLNP